MVAETHTSFSDLERSDIIEFIVHIVAQVDEQIDVDELTLQRCGFTDDLEIEQLARIVGEEFSERTLVGQALEEVDATWLITDLVAALYPDID